MKILSFFSDGKKILLQDLADAKEDIFTLKKQIDLLAKKHEEQVKKTSAKPLKFLNNKTFNRKPIFDYRWLKKAGPVYPLNKNRLAAKEEASDITVQQLFADQDVPILYTVADSSEMEAIPTSALRPDKTMCARLDDQTIYLWNGAAWDPFIGNSGSVAPSTISFQYDTLQVPLATLGLAIMPFSGTIIGASVMGVFAPGSEAVHTLYINGVAITGLQDLVLSDTVSFHAATALNTFTSGDVIGLSNSEVTAATDIKFVKIFIYYT